MKRLIEPIIFALIVAVVILILMNVNNIFTSEKDAKRALSAQGFTDIQYTGYNFFACSQDDFFHTGFKAKNAQGIVVSGTVCSGILFKNATVRF